MSIYSGFATRALESAYNKCLGDILQFYQTCLLTYLKKGKFYIDKSGKSSLSRVFSKLYNTLKTLEHQKHLKPMFSLYCNELAEFFKYIEDSKQSIMLRDYNTQSALNNWLDFQIFNDGLAYDDSRIQKFSPKRLETVIEKPRTKSINREKTQKLMSIEHSPIAGIGGKYHSSLKKKKNYINNSHLYQNRAYSRLDHDVSF
jgi:hypothetical protein